ncbi:MAG: GNAT family N-acetyltransferase [Thermomicrobiales bacterium]
MAETEVKIIDRAGEMYELRIGDTTVGQLTYRTLRSGRRSLMHTEIDEEYRGRGLGNALIRGALDDLQRQGATVSVFCPAVHAFITRHPEYEALVDVEDPGAWPAKADRNEDSPGS